MDRFLIKNSDIKGKFASMLRKGLTILLLIPTLILGSGIRVSIHFCGEDISEISLFSKGSCSCDEFGDEPDGCCKNQEVFAETDSFFSASGPRAFTPAQQEIGQGSGPFINHEFRFRGIFVNYFQIRIDDPPEITGYNQLLNLRV